MGKFKEAHTGPFFLDEIGDMRLRIQVIQLPPLRERGSDILILPEHFLQASDPPKVLAPDAVPALLTHSWPGNVRELRNVMQKASLTVPQRVIQRSDLSLDLPAERTASEEANAFLDLDFHTSVAELEKKLLQRALRQSKGNRSQAAELLKMRRQLFYAKLKEHGLDGG